MPSTTILAAASYITLIITTATLTITPNANYTSLAAYWVLTVLVFMPNHLSERYIAAAAAAASLLRATIALTLVIYQCFKFIRIAAAAVVEEEGDRGECKVGCILSLIYLVQ